MKMADVKININKRISNLKHMINNDLITKDKQNFLDMINIIKELQEEINDLQEEIRKLRIRY